MEELVKTADRGHRMSPLRWTCRSLRMPTAQLSREHCRFGHPRLSELLPDSRCSLRPDHAFENWRRRPLVSHEMVLEPIARGRAARLQIREKDGM
ncbi:MAG: hypothetical protein A3H27_05420 [Acidobacteria bacterium RIFCSPLOWO2_02_FULL_59_13]|nr:MAG: hypothetical protein A3H27_05420 [Acidobacteria bacterium RIFCSPLOWO2_02_FULL_59_13]